MKYAHTRYGLLEAEEKLRSEQVKALIEGMRSQLASPSDQAVADFFGVNRSTVQRWKKATTRIRDTDLLIRKLGADSAAFERLLKKEIEVGIFLERYAHHWKKYLSEHAEVDKFISQILPRTNLTNIAKVLQAVTEIASSHLLSDIRGSSVESSETIQDLMSAGLKARKWRLERNGLERLAEAASISVVRMRDIWLGGRPDISEVVKLATVLGKTSEELLEIRDRQYGENGDVSSRENVTP